MTGTPAERDVAAVADWIASHLGAELFIPVEQLDREATFFSLGLTSQAAVTMVSRLGVRLGRDVPVATLWASPTVNGFAAAVVSAEHGTDVPSRLLRRRATG